MGKLFGTDGIRGRANTYPMTADMALKVGRAVACYFKKQQLVQSGIIIGKDTRISGDMIENALAAGICSLGVDALIAGVIPTPAIAYLTAEMEAMAGIVISASHNPFEDNGIKLFKADGYKLSDTMESEIESLILNGVDEATSGDAQNMGRRIRVSDASDRYMAFLKEMVASQTPFAGLKIVLDCANGATHQVAPKLFESLGASVETIFNTPDGKNINAQCGSQHPETLSLSVKQHNACIGLAFDGDGDRLIVVDEKGKVLTGDQVLAICARHMKQLGALTSNTVVSTIMSNLGLREALKKLGIDHLAAQVGDRYVMQEMLSSGAIIGGEDSGHMIFLDHHTTGDGIIAALKVMEVMAETGEPISSLAGVMKVFPQELINVEVSRKPDLNQVPEVVKIIDTVEEVLGEEGRVLVRYSGTQNICRVMVEGPEKDITAKYCAQIAEIVRENIG